MKFRLIPLLTLLAALATPTSHVSADTKYVYKDAARMNELFNALGGPGWARKAGWPVPTGELSNMQSFPDHVSFATTVRTAGQTTYYEYYLKTFNISSLGASGQFPATIAFDSLEAFEVGWDTLITGPFPQFQCPRIKRISFASVNLTGSIPNYSFPNLERLSILSTKATGNTPALDLPKLTYLQLNSNDHITGTLGVLRAPLLKELEITFNDSLRGSLFPLDFPLIERIQIRYNPFLAGTISNLSLPNAQYVSLDACAFTGPLPEVNMPKCEYFFLANNKLTGSIGTLTLPLVRHVELGNNSFDGTMAAQSLPECTEFAVHRNQLKGDFPLLAMPKCSTIDVHQNEFTGSIATLDLPKLTSINASNNKFSGPLPTAWKSQEIKTINLGYNKLTGTVSAWQLPALQYLILERNQLSGTFPSITAPKLQTIFISSNKFSGPFPTLACPALASIGMDSNKFTDLPDIKSTCPKVTSLNAQANKLMFDAMERNASFGSTSFLRQDSVELFTATLQDNRTMFSVKVGGTANEYRWIRVNDDGTEYWYSDTDNDTLIVPPGERRIHYCWMTNTTVTGVALYSRKHPGTSAFPNPWVKGMFSFYAEGADGWEVDEEKPVISFSGRVIINELLNFEGSIKIDTEAVSVSAEGLFSLKDVPLPGGGSGTFVVCEGAYVLRLLGSDGTITNFVNSQFKKLPSFAGITVEITNIKLVGGRQASGISIDGTIEIAGMANGCKEDEPGPTKIEIEGLAYSRTEGASLDGIKIEDLGFASFPTFCVKRLEAKYEREKDKLSFGASIAMPFAEVGGGIAMILDKVDSIAWRIEATKSAIPLGQSNLGMSGFFGSISGIQSKPLDVELGGIFVTMIPKDFVKFDASGTYTAPATLGLKLDGQAIPTPTDDDVYQLKLKGSAKYDFAEGMAKLEGETHIGTDDGEDYFIDGELKLDLKAESLALKGEVKGGYQIETFGEEAADEYPYDWINAKLGLPKKVTTEARFVFIKSRVLYGVAHLGKSMGDLNYVFDFRKSWRDPDFLYWNRVPATEELRGGNGEIATTRNVIVPDNATRMVVRVKGASTLPASTLTLPNGTTVTGTDAAKQIDYTVASGNMKAFWTVLEPSAGRWTINAPSAATGDIIEIFVDALPAPFTFTHTQQGRNVTLTWTPQGNVDDSIAFFVVGTGTTADGLDLGSAALMSGTKTITIPMDLPVCTFNIEAQGTRGMDVVADTSATPVSVQTGSVTAPSMMLAQYFTGQKLLNITWTPSAVNDKNVKSYVIHARNSAGEERLLGEAFRWVGWVSVPYTRQNGDKITVRGVDANGRMGCPTELSNITTDVAELTSEMSDEIQIIPHPVDQRAEAHFWNTTAGVATVSLVDLQGRRVVTLFNGFVDAGPVEIGVDGTAVPSGVYTMLIRINEDTRRIPLVIAR